MCYKADTWLISQKLRVNRQSAYQQITYITILTFATSYAKSNVDSGLVGRSNVQTLHIRLASADVG